MSGTVRPIIYYGQDVLHRPCKPVESFGDELAELVADMFASMYAVNGVGLAANQIGVDARVFVMDCRDDAGDSTVATLVNPVLRLPASPRRLDVDDEGCLSVPGQFTETPRAASAAVDGFDVTGAPVTVEGTGLVARCLQHECDHLDGIVYVDRLPRKVRKRLLKAAELPVERPGRG